jgi:hypothetical protein
MCQSFKLANPERDTRPTLLRGKDRSHGDVISTLRSSEIIGGRHRSADDEFGPSKAAHIGDLYVVNTEVDASCSAGERNVDSTVDNHGYLDGRNECAGNTRERPRAFVSQPQLNHRYPAATGCPRAFRETSDTVA